MNKEQFAKKLEVIAEKHIPSNYPCAKKRAKAKSDQLKLIGDIAGMIEFLLDELSLQFVLNGPATEADIKGIVDEQA